MLALVAGLLLALAPVQAAMVAFNETINLSDPRVRYGPSWWPIYNSTGQPTKSTWATDTTVYGTGVGGSSLTVKFIGTGIYFWGNSTNADAAFSLTVNGTTDFATGTADAPNTMLASAVNLPLGLHTVVYTFNGPGTTLFFRATYTGQMESAAPDYASVRRTVIDVRTCPEWERASCLNPLILAWDPENLYHRWADLGGAEFWNRMQSKHVNSTIDFVVPPGTSWFHVNGATGVDRRTISWTVSPPPLYQDGVTTVDLRSNLFALESPVLEAYLDPKINYTAQVKLLEYGWAAFSRIIAYHADYDPQVVQTYTTPLSPLTGPGMQSPTSTSAIVTSTSASIGGGGADGGSDGMAAAETSHSAKAHSTAATVGIALGTIIGFCVLVALGVLVWYRRRKRRQQARTGERGITDKDMDIGSFHQLESMRGTPSASQADLRVDPLPGLPVASARAEHLNLSALRTGLPADSPTTPSISSQSPTELDAKTARALSAGSHSPLTPASSQQRREPSRTASERSIQSSRPGRPAVPEVDISQESDAGRLVEIVPPQYDPQWANERYE